MGEELRLSATDLSNHLACPHLTNLDRLFAHGRLDAPSRWDPMLAVLRERGLAHERAFLDHLRQRGLEVVELDVGGSTADAAAESVSMMRRGTDVIAQATLVDDGWLGRADVLLKVSRPSSLGDWSYEVLDTKLARETRGGTVLQLCLYTDLLAQVQRTKPEYMYVVSPVRGFVPERFRVDDFLAYYRLVRRRLQASLEGEVDEVATYPVPTQHCDICKWWEQCAQRRRKDDHLSLVAGMGRLHEREFQSWGVGRVAELAVLPTPIRRKPTRGTLPTYERLREQAIVQVESRTAGRIVYEPLSVVPGQGLARMPEPAASDVFLDFEGDPFAGDGGMEYLTGYVTVDSGQPKYHAMWALDRAAEKRAFESFIDDVIERWERDPALHIYHYAPYEPSAVKRLMGRYGTREDEVDRMLRAGLFVDLYAIVRQGFRIGVESYSIKSLEPLYEFERAVALGDAGKSLRAVEGAIELGTPGDVTPELRREVEGYNRDDCVSTLLLRDWLELERTRLIATGTPVDRPLPQVGEPPFELAERRQQVLALIEELMEGVPADRGIRSDEQQAQWLLAQLLEWHRREEKVAWWEFYHLGGMTDDERLDEACALAGVEFVDVVGGTAKCPIHRYRFPLQDLSIGVDHQVYADADTRIGTVVDVDVPSRTIDIKKTQASREMHEASLFAHRLVRANAQADALLRLASWVVEHGIDATGEHRAARDFLLRMPPRGVAAPGTSLRSEGEPLQSAARRIAVALSSGVLPIQGPPGTGKTYTAARMILALVQAGRRVGITAMSHKVIRNLLTKVDEAAQEAQVQVQCIQKIDQLSENPHPAIEETKSNQTVIDRLASGAAQVGAGTAWLWSRPDLTGAVDVLFVDEAGQMSIANACAVAQAAENLVLVGDPRQLEQPVKGSHPDGADVSALEHLLGGQLTIAEDRGLFLEETWRLHPAISAFTSEQFYDGRLRSRAGLDRQTLLASGHAHFGLYFLAVEHEGNQNSSTEEADAIARVVGELVDGGATWTDESGVEHRLTRGDIVIVAPYNAQVTTIAERVPGVSVGTVDKFQGQEAPLVIYSMTSSSPEDAPRGMEFLYSRNRLNVATSRARCVCILVASPRLFEPDCRTPRQMQLANSHCRYLERAQRWGGDAGEVDEECDVTFAWPAYYPDDCPPTDAEPTAGVVYRLVRTDPPTPDDFQPLRVERASQNFGDQCCMASGLSVLRKVGDAERLRRRVPGLRSRLIAIGRLSAEHGLLKNTATRQSCDGHHTWWLPLGLAPVPLFQVTSVERTEFVGKEA